MNEQFNQKIRLLINKLNSQKGANIPYEISEINNIPVNSFEDLQLNIKNGNLNIFKASNAYDLSIFSLLSTNSLKLKSNIGMIIQFIGPIFAIAMAILYSWWWLLLVPILFVIGFKIVGSAYRSAIFNAAHQSELAFCLLYFLGQIGINDIKEGKGYYWNLGTNATMVNPQALDQTR